MLLQDFLVPSGDPAPLPDFSQFDSGEAGNFGTGTLGQAQGVALPDIGVDVGGAVQSGVSSLGTVVLIAVGGYAAFLIVRRGIYWLRYALAYIG